MPRGRPKGSKNKSTLRKLELLSTQETVEEQPVEEVTSEETSTPELKKETVFKYTFQCELCGKTFPGSPVSVDFMRLTGKADYYREARSKKLCICNECSKELSDLIDKWLLKKNPNLRKFPLTGAENEEEVS